MFLTRSLQRLYAATIDRSKFREIGSRVAVFVIPLFFLGKPLQWAGLILVVLGCTVRAWAAGHLYKDAKQALGGPYLLVRHPLYLGSCLLSLGFIVTLQSWVVALLLGTVTFLQYWHTIRHEEQNLLKRFGNSYAEYCQKVAPLWPTPSSLQQFFLAIRSSSSPATRFSFSQYMKNKEYECLMGVTAVLALLILFSK